MLCSQQGDLMHLNDLKAKQLTLTVELLLEPIISTMPHNITDCASDNKYCEGSKVKIWIIQSISGMFIL